jgi:hypothetical protein
MYFGKGDRQILRLMVSEQLRRAETSNLKPQDEFALAANGDDIIDVRAWGGEMTIYGGGVSTKADLFIVDVPRRDTVLDIFTVKRMSTQWLISTTAQAVNASLVSGTETTGCLVYKIDGNSRLTR